ncbi:MAG: polysaccharide export protein [Candidatus Omnitrophica bacterium]|nr:polysaccharide export protein [Candidatus Omnitrophota bacterium]
MTRALAALPALALLAAMTMAPAPAEAQNTEAYRVQPEDVLQITVYEHEDLQTKARVSTGGDIAFPLLDKVKVAGLTVGEIEDKLTRALEKDYLVQAQVQVFIEEYHVKQITVLGAVSNPGKYDMHTEKETTVLEAIAMAGGFTKVASLNGTRVIRTEGGVEQALPVRVTDITKKGMKEKDIPIQPGDIIFVPESFF